MQQARKDYSCGQSARTQISTKSQPTNNIYVNVNHVLVIFGRVFNPLSRGCGRGQIFFSARDAQSQYLSVDTKFVSNEQRFWK